MAMSRELSNLYGLYYDIKTIGELKTEVDYLAHRLSGLMNLCRDDGYSIDNYVMATLNLPKKNEASE